MSKNESIGSDLAQQSSAPLAVVEPFADMYAMQMDLSSRLTIQQPSTAVHVQYECTVRNRATVHC